MKLKQIAIASLALASASSFAATFTAEQLKTINCTAAPTSATGVEASKWMVKCKPTISFVVAGSSALADLLATTIASQFEGNVIEPVDMSSEFGSKIGATSSGNVKIWYGLNTITKKPMVFYYQKANGSAAGVTALMGKKGAVPEAKFVNLTKGAETFCEVNTSNQKIECTNAPIDHVADLAVSDVRYSELLQFSSTDGKLQKKEKDIVEIPLPMVGFGVAVSKALYTELQKAQGIDYAGSCVHSVTPSFYTLACQPSLSTFKLATLLSKNGNITNVNQLVGTTGLTGALHISRRDEASGTQASSQMFFQGSGCSKSVYVGNVPALSTLTRNSTARKASDSTADLVVVENAVSGDVTTRLGDATDYVIGVIPLASSTPRKVGGTSANFLSTAATPEIAVNYRFVKLNGVSPDLTVNSFTGNDRNLADKARTTMISGEWPLQVEAFSYHSAKASELKKPIITAMNNAINNSTRDAPGISYLNGTADVKTTVRKASGNCSPLIAVTPTAP